LPRIRGTAILKTLTTLVLLGLAGQVALARLGAVGQTGTWEARSSFGGVAEAIALVCSLTASGLRRHGGRLPLVGIFALITLQHGSATVGGWAGAFHSVNSLVMIALAVTVLRRLKADVPVPAAPHLRIGDAPQVVSTQVADH